MPNGDQAIKYSTEALRLEPCDVAVGGGGIAGVFAALAAARHGANTVLIEQHSFVGGQGTAGGVHTFCGETRLVNDAWAEMIERLDRFGGIAEYRPNHDGRWFEVEMLKYVLQEMLGEAGVRLMLHTHVVDVERDGDTAQALILFNKSGIQRLACNQIVDATGDADIVARGAWPIEKGGPVFLPTGRLDEDPDTERLQLPMSLYFTMVRATDEKVVPVLPEGSPVYETDADFPMLTVHDHGHQITLKMKVIGHDATNGESLSEAEQAARRQMMAVIYHLQTTGYRGRTYPDFKLAWVAPHIGVREGRRVVAQYRMTVDDLMNGRHFDDAIGVGSYHVDYHWPTVPQRAGSGLSTQAPPYHIPLRSMRPAGSTNLLAPGRSISGQQIAMSSFRVMGICAQTGYAAGVAAALAAGSNQSLDDVPVGLIQSSLRAAGVRLDHAPYNNYLRVRRTVDEPVFENNGQFDECHASTLALLPNGDYVSAWFGGTAEGADDVDIWMSIRHEGTWSEPRKIAAFIGEPMWNPVLFTPDTSRNFAETPFRGESDETPRLLLYFRVGRQITSWRSYVMESTDGGRSWSDPEALTDGILGPIKNKPIVLSDGTWLAGSSVETDSEWYCSIERSNDQGRTWRSSEPLKLEGHPMGIIQPTLWESQPGHVHALLRSRGVGQMCRSDSTDGGKTWSPVYKTDLPNNNSGIDVAKLVPSPGDPGYGDGPAPLVLAYNPVKVEEWSERTPLVLAASYDNGHSWPDVLPLVELPGEYSYPAVIPTSGGVAVSYTFDRKHIAFGHYSLEHLTGQGLDIFAHIGDHAEHTEWMELLSQVES